MLMMAPIGCLLTNSWSAFGSTQFAYFPMVGASIGSSYSACSFNPNVHDPFDTVEHEGYFVLDLHEEADVMFCFSERR